MRVTRSYWLGLGSGLILSAMLTMVITTQQGQAVIPKEPAFVPPVTQQPTQPPAEGTKQADLSSTPETATSTTQPSESNQLSVDEATDPQSASQSEESFVIPKGASSERIADLLVAQDFIKDKESFLVSVRQMEVERKFIAGTFTLSRGLTSAEIIRRLIK